MTDQQILTKAITKAIENGWSVYRTDFPKISPENLAIDALEGIQYYKQLIFNHDFAKALWGEESREGFSYDLADWEFHLQQMVIAPDPIKYLEKNL